MGDYVIDRETLGQFVDEMMKQKPVAANTPEELAKVREDLMEKLDNSVNFAIMNALSDEKLAEVSAMLDKEETSESEFLSFFERSGVNVQDVITRTMQAFAQNYVGGTNE